MKFLNIKYLIGGLAAVAVPPLLFFPIVKNISSNWIGISGGGTVRDQINQYGLAALDYDSSYSGEITDPDLTKIARRYIRNVEDNFVLWRRSDFFNNEMSDEFCINNPSYYIPAPNNESGSVTLSSGSSSDQADVIKPKYPSSVLAGIESFKNYHCWKEPGNGEKSGKTREGIDIFQESIISGVVSSLKRVCKKVMDSDVSLISNNKDVSNVDAFSNWNRRIRKYDAISYCTKPKPVGEILLGMGYEILNNESGDMYWKYNLDKFKKDNPSDFLVTRLTTDEEEKIKSLKMDCLIATSSMTIDSNFINYFESAKKYCVSKKPWWKIY